MKKGCLIIILILLSFCLSACKIFDDYVLEGYDKILANNGYTQTLDINTINESIDKFVYKWESLTEGEYISPKGTYIKKSDSIIYVRTPSLKEIYIDKTLKTIDIESDSQDLKVYEYERGVVFVVEDKYLYALDNDYNNVYVNEDYTRTFRLKDETLVVDCSDILNGLNKTKKSYINTNDESIMAYYKCESDNYSIYFISKTPSNFVADLGERNFNVYEVDRSYIGDVDNHKVWYLMSGDENYNLKVTYEVIGKENVVTTRVDVYNIKANKLTKGFITSDDDWNTEVKNKLNTLGLNIPFYKMGKFYLINDELSKNNYTEDFCRLTDDCYKIYDYYYLPMLDEYKAILEANGFSKYEPPVDIKKAENQEYNEWRAAYNFWLSTKEDKYFDTYINEEEDIFVKLTYDITLGNIIEIYKYNSGKID